MRGNESVKKGFLRYASAERIMRWCMLMLACICFSKQVCAQHKTIHGTVISEFTKEKISFASIHWKKAGNGTVADSAGIFRFPASRFVPDTLIVSYAGFQEEQVPVSRYNDSAGLKIMLPNAKEITGITVTTKYNKGLLWWKQIVSHKQGNNPYKATSYFYELYNKMEVDIENINRQKFEKQKLLKPFAFILDNVDSQSESKPFLPVFITESVSDCYYTTNPANKSERIKAVQTNGIKNESVLQFMGGLNQRINSYDNYMSVFGKECISPLSDLGSRYYNYRGADTQLISGQRYLHLFFSPKREGENAFSGDCWVHRKTWAVKKITLNLSATSNINYINRLSIVQEFKLQNDSTWTMGKDKFVVEVSLAGKQNISFIARKTSLYDNVQTNQPFITAALAKNKKEDVMVDDSAKLRGTAYWQEKRMEPLSGNELKVYKMLDTLKQMPLFKQYTNTITFITDGRKSLGKIEIGPWYKWISGNQHEKIRVRFDVGTTASFSNYLRLHSYLAYGFGDRALKGRADVTYKLPWDSSYSMRVSYTHDLDNGRVHNNDEDATTDNIFSQLIRRAGIKQKFLLLDEVKFSVKKDWPHNISTEAMLSRTDYETFTPLPSRRLISTNNRDLINTEAGINIKYSPGRKRIKMRRREIDLHGDHPVIEARYAMGLKNVLSSEYAYSKVFTMLSQNFRIPRWGKINYSIYGGKVFGGALPFMLLEVHPGNEIYYYNKNAFNLMNRFEYISDHYAGFNVEHNFEKKLLNLMPFMRKTNMRQFWNVKAVWGDVTAENRRLNIKDFSGYRLRSLKGESYIEAGTGLDNIFKFFRIDLVWRFAPEQTTYQNTQNSVANFGVFGSFHLQF